MSNTIINTLSQIAPTQTQRAHYHCLFASEIDKHAQETFKLNLPQYANVLYGDITQESTQAHIPPKFDMLCAGFPCQAFSIAGLQKGFNDTRGTLFFEIAKIAQNHRPKVLFLENVKNLLKHDNGNTYATIKATLENLGYFVYAEVLSAATHANIPQNRERLFIVAFDKAQVSNYADFTFPPAIALTKTTDDCLNLYNPYTPKRRICRREHDKYYYSLGYGDIIYNTQIKRGKVYQIRRSYIRENKSSLCPTLTANMGTGGHNVPIIKDCFGIRKLTPRECFNFQGFDSSFKLPRIADSHLYKQAGNSIVLPLVARIFRQIENVLNQKDISYIELFAGVGGFSLAMRITNILPLNSYPFF